jgi:hypothetical protein
MVAHAPSGTDATVLTIERDAELTGNAGKYRRRFERRHDGRYNSVLEHRRDGEWRVVSLVVVEDVPLPEDAE